MSAPGLKIDPNRLREMREARGFSQTQLAAAIDRTFEAVRIMEKGQMRPSPETLDRLCAALACAREELLDDEEEGA